MTTYTTIAKNSTTYTPNSMVSGSIILTGQAIGLLLTLTYSAISGFTSHTTSSKNSTAYSTVAKN